MTRCPQIIPAAMRKDDPVNLVIGQVSARVYLIHFYLMHLLLLSVHPHCYCSLIEQYCSLIEQDFSERAGSTSTLPNISFVDIYLEVAKG